jgi:hypothetical protein
VANLLLVIDSDALHNVVATFLRGRGHTVRSSSCMDVAAAETLVEPADLLIIDDRAAAAGARMTTDTRCAWMSTTPVVLLHGGVSSLDACGLNVREVVPLATFSLVTLGSVFDRALRPAWAEARDAASLLRTPPITERRSCSSKPPAGVVAAGARREPPRPATRDGRPDAGRRSGTGG